MQEIELARPPYGEYQPVGRSVLVKRVVALPATVRRVLGVNDYVVALVDSIVTMCAIVLEHSEVPLLQRLSDAQQEFTVLKEAPTWITEALQYVSDADLASWVKRLERADNRKVLNRLLGTATFNAMRQDAQDDARTVLLATRIGVNVMRPWALAMDDALAALTDMQRQEIGFPQAFDTSLFRLALNADEVLGTTLSSEVGLKIPEDIESLRLRPAEVEATMGQFRDLLRARADENLAELGDVFSRKIRGARDALDYSVDGVSQGANSLVELIDRIARDAFSEAEVLEWLRANGRGNGHHVYTTAEGKTRPTKQAQLLCLAWAGAPTKQEAPGAVSFQKMAAYALLNIREALQKLKHADENTEAERVLLRRSLDAIEAAIVLMVKMSWALVGREYVQALRMRLGSR